MTAIFQSARADGRLDSKDPNPWIPVGLAALAGSKVPFEPSVIEDIRATLQRYEGAPARFPDLTEELAGWVLYENDLGKPDRRDKLVAELLSRQQADGGWGLATLGDWKRDDDLPQDLESSDGYGTGFVLYVLRRSGMPSSEEPLRRGVEWLKTHQRESGRWFTRSLHQDSMHYITHAGTAMAVMALSACNTGTSAAPK